MGKIIIRQPLTTPGMFAQDNIVANQAEAAVNVSGQMNVSGVAVPGSGECFGIGVTLSAVATAGNLFLRPTLNGVPTTTQHDAGLALGAAGGFFRITDANRFFSVTGEAGMFLQSVGLAPVTLDIIVILYVVFNRGVGVDN